MSRVTSKLQVTIPKAVADSYGIVPGVDVDWEPAGAAIRVQVRGDTNRDRNEAASVEQRLQLFDQATVRQRARETQRRPEAGSNARRQRGWSREDLYSRGA